MKEIHLKDQYIANDLSAYEHEGAVCIEVFEFDCMLSKEDTVRLSDFLLDIVNSQQGRKNE
jgi:hypothetical protein